MTNRNFAGSQEAASGIHTISQQPEHSTLSATEIQQPECATLSATDIQQSGCATLFASSIQRSECAKLPTTGLQQPEFSTLPISDNQRSEPLPPEFPRDPHSLVCYVDGSYNHSIPKYAFGCVFLLPDGLILTESGNGDQPASLALRNVTGEMLGAMYAVRFAMKNAFTHIDIRYDYEGIEKWVTGAWKSKTDLTKKYANAMRSWGTKIRITFRKVTAHTKVYYNDMADKLAKEALLGSDGIPELRTIAQMKEIR
jgi:ribonuclease HI